MIGNRCEQFKVISIGIPLESYEEKDKFYYTHLQKLIGEKTKIKKFIESLKEDKKIKRLEINNNLLFFTYSLSSIDKVPSTYYNKKVFFIKPVIVDHEGYENWEIASLNKQSLIEFIAQTRKLKDLYNLKIKKLVKTKLNELYFPQVMPLLSIEQLKAIELATKEGYYNYPRKIKLSQLAKISKKSLSTYREHLRKAEKKLMPDLMKNIKN